MENSSVLHLYSKPCDTGKVGCDRQHQHHLGGSEKCKILDPPYSPIQDLGGGPRDPRDFYAHNF